MKLKEKYTWDEVEKEVDACAERITEMFKRLPSEEQDSNTILIGHSHCMGRTPEVGAFSTSAIVNGSSIGAGSLIECLFEHHRSLEEIVRRLRETQVIVKGMPDWAKKTGDGKERYN